jgi:Vitamin-D-receptor interacting Mediator subunit 4
LFVMQQPSAQQREYIRELAAAAEDLRTALQRAEKVIETGRIAAAAKVSVNEIVAYAQKISGTTSAPDYWQPGMPMIGFVPPAPLPEMMRRGVLVRVSDKLGKRSIALA